MATFDIVVSTGNSKTFASLVLGDMFIDATSCVLQVWIKTVSISFCEGKLLEPPKMVSFRLKIG